MYVWSHGLVEYLRHSNEDIIYGTFIGKLLSYAVRRIWPDCARFIRIADIGCGTGSKAVEIAQYLREDGIKTHWELVDLDERWKHAISENVRDDGKNNDMRFDVYCPLSAESWIQSSTAAPHVAQFIQVPYDDQTEEMVYNLTMNLAARQSIVLISTEHPQSDLNLIRKTLTKLGYPNLPSGRATSLEARFKDRGLIVKRYTLGKQYLDIGSVGRNESSDWLWDLIFGTRRDMTDDPKLATVINVFSARGFVARLNTSLLSVPDVLMIVRQRT